MPLTVGLSLPVGYLGAAGPPDSCPFTEMLGPREQGLRALREAGVSSLELRSVHTGTPRELALEAYRQAAGSGFAVTVHGVLPTFEDGLPVEKDLAAIDAVAEVACAEGTRLVVTVHTYSGTDRACADHARATEDALRRLLSRPGSAASVRFALELSRDKDGMIDPSTSYERLAEMVGQFTTERVGICWDFGHNYANIARKCCDELPPDEFLRYVIHTHIHDLGDNGKTHCPLRRENQLLERQVSLLRGHGYSGPLNLELSPGRFPEARAQWRELLFGSIRRLQEVAG